MECNNDPQDDGECLADEHYFYVTTDVGLINYDVTLQNPLKGLVPNPNTMPEQLLNASVIPHSLEFYYIPFDSVCINATMYSWDGFETLLNESSQKRYSHTIPRFYIHYPGQPIRLPQFLLETVEIQYYDNNEQSPVYSDPILLNAIKNFIIEFGKKYDGDKRIGFIQVGLLGLWGEWHAPGNMLPDFVKDTVLEWFSEAFHETRLQTRYPNAVAYKARFGYHDDSFAYETLDGVANGENGKHRRFYFWPYIMNSGQDDFWKYGPMGGEGRPQVQIGVFEPEYPSGTFHHQDFMLCVNTTHTTYMKNAFVFKNTLSTVAIHNAKNAISRMGYNFYIQQVAVKERTIEDSKDLVDIDVTIQQVGIAPFYYPLGLRLSSSLSGCEVNFSTFIYGVEGLLEEKESGVFTYVGVPREYIQGSIEFSLYSDMTFPERPIKLAQGIDGRLTLNIPPF